MARVNPRANAILSILCSAAPPVIPAPYGPPAAGDGVLPPRCVSTGEG